MTIWDRESADFIMNDVEERTKAYREFMRSQEVGVPLGQENVDDETWVTFFESKLAQHPIVPIIHEDSGRMFAASPFLLALELADGGREVMRRYARIRGLDEERP